MAEATGKRILVVDDERALCEVLKARLETFGYAVSIAYDGQEGWGKVLSDSPDLILLDIQMPGEDGYSLLRKLRSYHDDDYQKEKKIRKLPVIVITGRGEGMKGLFEQEQISGYVTKPIDSQVIKKLIEESLSQSS